MFPSTGHSSLQISTSSGSGFGSSLRISTSSGSGLGSGLGLLAGEPAERLALALRFCTPPARGAPRLRGLEALRLGPAFFRPLAAEDFSGDVAAPDESPWARRSCIARRSSGEARSTCASSSPYSLKSKLVTASRPRRIMAARS